MLLRYKYKTIYVKFQILVNIFLNIIEQALQVNDNIKNIRKLRGFSQQEIADLIGQKRSTYAEWERNIVPKADILNKLAHHLGTTIDELLEENVAREKPKIFNTFFYPELQSKHVRPLAYNVKGLGEEAELTAQKMKVAQMFNTPQQLHSSTSP